MSSEVEASNRPPKSGGLIRLMIFAACAMVFAFLFALLGTHRVQSYGLRPEHFTFIKDVAEGAALLFAIFALIDGYEIRQHGMKSLESLSVLNHKISHTTSKLENIGDALSTRYIGSFPRYLTSIRFTIKQSKSHIRIMSDLVGHGSFTSSDQWEEINNEILRALQGKTTGKDKEKWQNIRSKNVKVTVLHTNASNQEKLFMQRHLVFGRDSDWDAMVAGLAHISIAKLVNRPELSPPEDSTPPFSEWKREPFLKRIIIQEQAIVSRLKRYGAVIHVSPNTLPFYLWIQDDTEAIFAFPTHAEVNLDANSPTVASAFWTQDKSIVASLIATFDRIVKENT